MQYASFTQRKVRFGQDRAPNGLATVATIAILVTGTMGPLCEAVRAQQLINNGSFATGDFTNWNTADVLDPDPGDTYNPGDPTLGNFSVQSSTTAPCTGLPTLRQVITRSNISALRNRRNPNGRYGALCSPSG
jgi:hypothetical protein